MPLYLDEIWFDWRDAESARRTLSLFDGMGSGSFNYPEGVRQVAGPWFSNEETKLIVILDIQDHTATFTSFGYALAHGLIARRRLTPIVEWSAVRQLAGILSPSDSG